LLFTILIFAGSARASEQTQSTAFDELYARSKVLEQSLSSFRARFTETTTSTLLVDPIVAQGTMVGARPVRLLLRYESPEKKHVLVDGDRLEVVWPAFGEHQQINIGRAQKAVDKYFAGASIKQMRSHFDIEVLDDPELPDTYLVELQPKRKRIKEGLSRLTLWLDRQTLIMVRMRMVFPSGDEKLIALEDIEVDVPIDDETFTLPSQRTEAAPPASSARAGMVKN
jgi:outer membrane lipoprotein-sorting protein